MQIELVLIGVEYKSISSCLLAWIVFKNIFSSLILIKFVFFFFFIYIIVEMGYVYAR